jgi:hypothetical protein
MLPARDRARVVIVSLTDMPDYAMTNYRFFDGSKFDPLKLGWHTFFNIKVDGQVIFSIFKF